MFLLRKINNIELVPLGSNRFRFRDIDLEWRQRSGVKSIQLKVFEDSRVVLLTNHRPGKSFVQEFLNNNYKWLCEKMDDVSSRLELAKKSGLLLSFEAASKLPLMGKAFELIFNDVKKAYIDFSEGKICIPESLQGEKQRIRKEIQKLYKVEAQVYLTKIQKEVSEQMNLFPKDLQFKALKSRWGSCSSRHIIQYNWKLIAAPREHIKYVVVHETAHLQHLDHSKEFWQLVADNCKDYKNSEKWLKNKQLYFEFLNTKTEVYR